MLLRGETQVSAPPPVTTIESLQDKQQGKVVGEMFCDVEPGGRDNAFVVVPADIERGISMYVRTANSIQEQTTYLEATE